MREPYDQYWELIARGVAPEQFFSAVYGHFPCVTEIYFEGTAFASDVLACLRRHENPGDIVPDRNTIWPKSTQIRCTFSGSLVEDLGLLSQSHAIPGLCDHLFLYRGGDFVLYWHDAFDGDMCLDPAIPEDQVASFAAALRGAVRFVDHREPQPPVP